MGLRFLRRLTLTNVIIWGMGLAMLAFVVIRAVGNLASGAYGFDTFIRQLIFGLAQGGIYALIALGYTLVYGILFMINFAHGEVFMSGTYIGYFVIAAMDESGFLEEHTLLAVTVVFLVAMATSVIVAVLLERIAYRPLRKAPRLVPLITAIGASLFLQQAFRGLFGTGTKNYPNVHLYVLPQVFGDLEWAVDPETGRRVALGLDLISGRYPVTLWISPWGAVIIRAVVIAAAVALAVYLGLRLSRKFKESEVELSPLGILKWASNNLTPVITILIMAVLVVGQLWSLPGDLQAAQMGDEWLIHRLDGGDFDAVMAGISSDDAQTLSYLDVGPVLVVREDDAETITGPDDLRPGSRVAVTNGGLAEEAAHRLDGVEVVTFHSTKDAFLAVLYGEVDAAVEELPVAAREIEYWRMELVPVGAPIIERPVAIALSPNRDDLAEVLNHALHAVVANGEYAKAYRRWFGVEPAELPFEPDASGESYPDVDLIVIGINANQPPLTTLRETGDIDGFEVDLMEAMAEEAGFEIRWVDVTGSIKLIIRPIYFLVFVAAVLMMLGLFWFVQYTKAGKAMRAVAEDKEVAALMGIDVDRVIVTTFVLGAALAGAAGVLFALYTRQVTHTMGFIPGLKAFTAAVLGGIGNIPGAMFGGFFLGLVESVAPALLGIAPQLKDVISFGLLVMVLIFRPTGILGEVLSEKKA